ncbi:hypothetical protein [Dyella tabacisoli]|uniref:Uncharacterized protein n=1 Tax=Dyella tabacisoli TaxID=2282381 RepID=A0A369UMJ7_9GAMM|nr:hypothetical protein [Dyella tabacisoli]RDD80938.1 hypothetical protein DVJ77_14630 [Dyella tabacisoli]
MNTPLQRALAAYRPLYLNGLLMDGQYRLPAKPKPIPQTAPTDPCRAAAMPGKPLSGVTA